MLFHDHIQQILVKIDREKDNKAQIKAHIKHVGQHLKSLKNYRSVQITYNVDPQ